MNFRYFWILDMFLILLNTISILIFFILNVYRTTIQTIMGMIDCVNRNIWNTLYPSGTGFLPLETPGSNRTKWKVKRCRVINVIIIVQKPDVLCSVRILNNPIRVSFYTWNILVLTEIGNIIKRKRFI